MFGDGDWDAARTDAQERRLHAWLAQVERLRVDAALSNEALLAGGGVLAHAAR